VRDSWYGSLKGSPLINDYGAHHDVVIEYVMLSLARTNDGRSGEAMQKEDAIGWPKQPKGIEAGKQHESITATCQW
jgi:hypothetical protein